MRNSSATTSIARVFVNTVVIAVVVTAIALVIAFPIAFALTRLSPAGARSSSPACCCRCGSACWCGPSPGCCCSSATARSTGCSSRAGSSTQPLPLLFNHTGVADRHGARAAALRGAADLCGAGAHRPGAAARERRARRLAADDLPPRAACRCRSRGVATAATFIFLLSLGFFVTPALLGGAVQHHAVDADRQLRQRAAGLAARRRGARWCCSAHALAVARRRRPLRSGRAASRRRADERAALRSTASSALVAAFLVLPILAIVPAAFSAQSFIRLPPDDLVAALVGRVLRRSVVAARAADEPEGRAPSRRWCRSWPEPPRRSASRGSGPRAGRC